MAYIAQVPNPVPPRAPDVPISGLMSPQPQQGGIQGLLSGMGERLMAAPGPENLISTQILANSFGSGADGRTIMTGVPEAAQARQIGIIRQQEADAAQQDREKAVERESKTREWFSQNAPDLLPWVDAGMTREAFGEIQRRNTPQKSDLMSVGGHIYDPATGQWISPPQGSEMTDTQQNLMWRAQQAGLQPGTPEWQQFMMSGGSGGTSLSVGPDGSVSFQQGGGMKPLTEQQSKDTVYATRAEGALPIIDQYGSSLTNPVERAVEGDPTGLARGLQSQEFQLAQQAGKEFLQAILRKDTGAAITPQETAEYGSVYLPVPGDTPAVLEQKRVSRSRALEAMKAGLPPAAILAQERALAASGGQGGGYTAVNPQTGERVTWNGSEWVPAQ